jgi:hypothetical protein
MGLIAQDRYTYRPIPTPGQLVVKPDLGPAVIVEPVTRPPLAGPYAFSRIPTPVRDKPHVFLMHDIASTWLFTNLSSGYGDVFYCTNKAYFIILSCTDLLAIRALFLKVIV